MITYTSSVEGITPAQLEGFFVGWPSPPTPEFHLRIRLGSAHVILALDEAKVVGFITAVSDGVLSAYIPLLEVLPEYQGRGIGKELATTMLAKLDHLYMIDVVCDPDLIDFYESMGLKPAAAAIKRNYERQSGGV